MMYCKACCIFVFYLVKSLGIFSWVLRSLFLLHQRYSLHSQDMDSIWNIFTSLFVLFLDLVLHVCYLVHDCSPLLHKICLVFILIGIGPVLLSLSLLGSLTDSISYDDVFCESGCVKCI